MQTKASLWITLLFFAAIVSIATISHANRGAVLKVDGDRAYVDLGTDVGVATGSLLTLFHVIAVKHPVTKKPVRDSFPLAKLRVINAGAKMSIAIIPDPFVKRIRVGDEIELASPEVVYVDPWKQPSSTGLVDPYDKSATLAVKRLAERKQKIAEAEKRLAQVASLEAAWAATLGKSPAARVAVWREYLDANPDTRYRDRVSIAITELETMIETAAPTDDEREAARVQARINTLERLAGGFDNTELIHAAPKRIDEGVPLSLAFLVAHPAEIRDAWVYYRGIGDDSYLRIRLTADGDSYLIADIPADVVRAPGVEYFVEVLGHAENAAPREVVGSDSSPYRVAVEKLATPVPIDRRGRSRVSMTLDYVDFDGIGSKNKFDQYWYGEIDFMYRFRLRGLYSLRLGFGTMNGTGGPKDVIDEDPTDSCMQDGEFFCRDVAYNYAYTELEWHLGDYFGVMLRPQVGSAYRDNTPIANEDREFFDAFGIRARVRFGREDGSNLVIGASATEELGRLVEAGFTWDVIKEVPLVFSVHVTDQPVIEDFGVRLLADVGLRKLSWVYPSIRIAYQARDIDHAGLSAGMAANFDW